MSTVPPDVVKDFAPTGTLRVAINLGNSVLAQTDKTTGKPRGISVDLAGELGRRLGLTPQFTTYDAAGKVFAALKSNGAWDVAFSPSSRRAPPRSHSRRPTSSSRAPTWCRRIRRCGRSPTSIATGVRIAVATGSAYDLYLSRTLKHAQLVRAPTGDGRHGDVRRRQARRVGRRAPADVVRQPPSRSAGDEGRFMEIRQAMGMPKGRACRARYLRGFVEEMKA